MGHWTPVITATLKHSLCCGFKILLGRVKMKSQRGHAYIGVHLEHI
jgi:hypothetical protein